MLLYGTLKVIKKNKLYQVKNKYFIYKCIKRVIELVFVLIKV